MAVNRLIGWLRRLWRRWFPPPPPEPVYVGRQQLRQAARTEAARQLQGAPVGRAVRRRAARDVAQRVTGGQA